jgi:hypothetical protein
VHFLALPAAWAEQAGMPKEMVLRHLCDWAIGGGFPPGAFVYPSAAPIEPFDIYMSGRAMAEDSPYGRRPGGVSVSSNHWGLALLGQVLLTGSVTGTGAEIQRPGPDGGPRQAAAVAICQAWAASARKIRRVRRETRWR